MAAAAIAAAALAAIRTLPPSARRLDDRGLPGGAPADAAAEVRGVFHVHSRHSDGSGTAAAIAAAAAAAGLDFVILTDHGDATTARPPVYRDGVLLVHGVEISTGAGHYIALGLPAAPYPLGGDPRGVVEDVRRLGGVGIVAHPMSPRAAMAWADWSLPIDGLEWINGDSQWRRAGLAARLRAAIWYPVRPAESLASLLTRPAGALARWDALAAGRPIVGLGAADAHARLADEAADGGGGLALRVPGYASVFRTAAIRVALDRPPTGAAAADAAALLDRLRAGRVHTVIDAVASPVRFAYTGRTADGRRVRMGEQAPPGAAVTLTAAAPAGSVITLLRGGRPVARARGPQLTHRVTPDGARAAYRVEVAAPGRPVDGVPWIVSNPIYVGPGGAPAPARAAAGTARAPDPGRPAAGLPAAHWRVERRPDARVDLEPRAAGVRIAFTLGPSAATYAAAARDLDGVVLPPGGAIRFIARAPRPMRASLQLRRPPGARPEARWRRSFHAGPTPQAVAARLDEFVGVGRARGEPLDLEAVETLLLVIDTVNTRPSTRGALVVEALAVTAR